MELRLLRKWFTEESTIGELYLDDEFYCYTLEDKVQVGEKIEGRTAIPYGEYRVIIDYSNRFKRHMPHILDVPGFEGIRIHAGNTSENTKGCILVGDSRGSDSIGQSKVAFERLLNILKDTDEEIIISIEEDD